MAKNLLCSNCFLDHGLKLESIKIGIIDNKICKNCYTPGGSKLNNDHLHYIAIQFFVGGSYQKTTYGGAPLLKYHNAYYQKNIVKLPDKNLNHDMKLIEESIKIGFFYYGPPVWRVGVIEPLISLQNSTERPTIIKKIISSFPEKTLSKNDIFYRLRKNPDNPLNHSEYDSPSSKTDQNGRLDLKIPIMYASQELDICVHECRVTTSDMLFVATLIPKEELKLLDLTTNIFEQFNIFESLKLSIDMLFSAEKHSYDISREIAEAAFSAGFHGIIYPSYFSSIYGRIVSNYALFGRPIENNTVKIICINRLLLNQIHYDIQLGPAEVLIHSPKELHESIQKLLNTEHDPKELYASIRKLLDIEHDHK